MSTIKLIYQCMFGPRLYKVYGDGRAEGLYEPGHLERWGDQIINIVCFFWNVGLYASPIIATVMYRKGYMLWDGALTIGKCVTGVGIVLAFSYFVRGLGRASAPQYIQFLRTLDEAKKNLNKSSKRALSQYDFDFDGWPVEFKWNDVGGEEKKQRQFIERPSFRRTTLDLLFAAPCSLITYIVANTFGLKLMYPGSMTGRSKLITENEGDRYKLFTRDGNEIDTMFIDRRKKHPHGDVLVICSEGNAGFYEIGIMATPIETGYSVLGWNHPGFAGSTGRPFPPQELNAVDCVMQFAIHNLGFLPENIVLFGWSIGGFPTSWAAMNYPDVKGVILDATFDDVMPLAITRMPNVLEPIIRRTIREYMNLNNAEQLLKYPGPIRIIRRTEDDVICTEDNKIASNRGNNLLVKILKYRYPIIMDDSSLMYVYEWLSSDVLQQRENRCKYKNDLLLLNKFFLNINIHILFLFIIALHYNSFIFISKSKENKKYKWKLNVIQLASILVFSFNIPKHNLEI
ncbi:Protein BAT5, putative [Gryllus bimaculatus]|nr:Protein BAT5, putative [Gryllus bimaculatus]